MTNKEYIEKRLDILEEMDEVLKGCVGCEIHTTLNSQKKVTELTNICKACPVGKNIATCGEKLLKTTSIYRKSKNI